MGKIIGESFDEYVDLQVKIRQKKLGSKYRSDELLTKITSKNPWLRLTSGVNITLEKANDIGYDKGENALAKYYQLQGGILNTSGSIRGGIGNYTDNGYQAYGFDSEKEYGLVPLPSLESFEITPKNNGSLTQANITIKCYNKQQFEKIETLYLRLGFTLLLEWGHSVFTGNNGELVTNFGSIDKEVSNTFLNPAIPFNSSLFTAFTPPSDPLSKILKLIETKREESSGNYDGLVGRVTNFDWDVTPDGHYTAKIKLTSTGDVIDSLKITPPLPAEEKETEEGDIPDYESIVASTPLGIILNAFKSALDGNKRDPRLKKLGPVKKVDRPGFLIFDRVSYFDGPSLTNDKIADASGLNVTTYKDNNVNYALKEIIKIDGKGMSLDYNYYYIKLGALLRIIQNFLLLYDDKHNNSPITKIDWGYEDNQYFMPVQDIFSADPRIMLIPSLFKNKIRNSSGKFKLTSFEDLNNNIGTEFYGDGNNFTFNFMHAYINMDFIIDLLIDNINNENGILLIDFMQSLCNGINQTLSNLIQLEPFHDFNDNTLYIVNKCNSDKVLRLRGKLKDPTKFRVNGLPQNGPQEGSFVKEVSINSTIPPDFATQIAIGAQANKAKISSNSTPFSKWNEGLTDRIVTNKNTAGEIETEDEITNDEALKKQEAKQKALLQSVSIAADYYNRFNIKESLFNLESNIKEWFKIQANIEEQKVQSEIISPIIIPISLSLKIDGLSGMKIFQKYTITEDFLPSNYQDSIEFIIKGISHNISEGGWTTTIEGQCIPKIKYAST